MQLLNLHYTPYVTLIDWLIGETSQIEHPPLAPYHIASPDKTTNHQKQRIQRNYIIHFVRMLIKTISTKSPEMLDRYRKFPSPNSRKKQYLTSICLPVGRAQGVLGSLSPLFLVSQHYNTWHWASGKPTLLSRTGLPSPRRPCLPNFVVLCF